MAADGCATVGHAPKLLFFDALLQMAKSKLSKNGLVILKYILGISAFKFIQSIHPLLFQIYLFFINNTYIFFVFMFEEFHILFRNYFCEKSQFSFFSSAYLTGVQVGCPGETARETQRHFQAIY